MRGVFISQDRSGLVGSEKRKPDLLEISFHSDAMNHGTLFMDRARVRHLTRFVPMDISLTVSHQSDRARIEEFISDRYEKCYGSRISCHYSSLMSVADKTGNIAAAVGLRFAADEDLFLEQYLQHPADEILSDKFGIGIGRDQIVEIGNLASSGRGASLFLFIAMAAYLHRHGIAYAAVTATHGLRRSFAMLGIDWTELGAARPEALPDKGAAWGSYYSRDPKIVAGCVSPALARLNAFLPLAENNEIEKILSYLPSSKRKNLQ